MTSEAENGRETAAPTREGRAVARLAAVQALYQMDLTQRDLGEVLGEFLLHRFETGGAAIYEGADREFFRDLVTGTVKSQGDIDKDIGEHLAEGWKLARINSIMRAILRAGVYEILARKDVPARVTINEYVEVAKDFFGADEPGVVNGVLDRIARKRRGGEFGKKPSRPAPQKV